MKPEIVALEIELKINRKSGSYFSFNETTLRAMQSGLCVLYQEVFICATHNRLLAVAVGGSAEFLVLTFSHHRQHYKKMIIHENEKALQCVRDIVDEETWRNCSLDDKLNSFQTGYDLSVELSSLASQLAPTVKDGLKKLSAQRLKTDEQSSLLVIDHGISSAFEPVVALRERFYRFCIN